MGGQQRSIASFFGGGGAGAKGGGDGDGGGGGGGGGAGGVLAARENDGRAAAAAAAAKAVAKAAVPADVGGSSEKKAKRRAVVIDDDDDVGSEGDGDGAANAAASDGEAAATGGAQPASQPAAADKAGSDDAQAPQRKRLRKAVVEDADTDEDEDLGDEDEAMEDGDDDFVVDGGVDAGDDEEDGEDEDDEDEDEDDVAPLFRKRPSGVGKAVKGTEIEVKPSAAEEKAKSAPAPSAKPKAKKDASKAKSAAAGVGDFAVEVAMSHATFDPAEKATWKAGEPVPFSFFRDCMDAIAEEPKRLRIQQLVTECLRTIATLTPEDMLPAVYMFARKLAPAHEGVEMNVGDAALIKTLCEATGSKESTIKEQYTESGDLGIVAEFSRSKQKCLFKPKPLTVRKVFGTFKQIATLEGNKSGQRRRDLIKQILVASQGSEARWIMSLLQGKTRIGLAEQSVVAALAHAAALQLEPEVSDKTDPMATKLAKAVAKKDAVVVAECLEAAHLIVKKCFSEMPTYDAIAASVLKNGVWDLYDHCHFTVGIPVKPMLAKPTNGVREVLDRFQDIEFTCEYKYDGERAQIHIMESGEVAIYSRNSENTTSKYPDLVSIVKRALKPGMGACVLDGEAVAVDRTTTPPTILPFQVLMNRKRKDVDEKDIEIKACMFAFDCLFLKGESLMSKSLVERREALYSAFIETPGEFEYAKTHTSGDADEIMNFLNESVAASTEGLIIKTLHGDDAHYEPSRRSLNWLKLKKDYMDSMGDSVDLVPIAALKGKGKRAGVYGAYLLACYDEDTETFQSVCKIGTGFSEEQLQQLTDALKPHVIDAPRPYYAVPEKLGGAGTPDVFFDAAQVWEVKAADLSISPVHLAAKGMVDEDKGIALRFPRFLRVRTDKKPEQATSSVQIADMYRSQAVIQSAAADDE